MDIKLQKILIAVLIILIANLLAFSGGDEIKSQWTTDAITVDGSCDDWNADLLNSFKKYEVDYAFKNNENYLYVVFIFKNPKHLSSIRETGLKFWINTEGKSKEKYGINFMKTKISADQMIEMLEQQKGKLTEAQKNKVKENESYIYFKSDVIDKKEKVINDEALDSSFSPPAFRSTARKDKTFVYELRIPLDVHKNLNNGQSLAPGDQIKIGFEWGGMTREMKKAFMANRASKGSKATATNVRSLDRERSERAPRTSHPSLARTPKEHSFWVDLTIGTEK